MKKYIFSAIFFFLISALALWGFGIFDADAKAKSIATKVGKVVSSSLTQASDPENKSDSTASKTTVKEGLDSEEFVGPVLPIDKEDASFCSRCQTSNALLFSSFPSFDSLTNSATSYLDNDNVLGCKSCGEAIDDAVDSLEKQESENVENIKQ